MKVLLTGGAGYVGSCIASCLLDDGHEVVIIDSLVTGREEFIQDKVFYKGVVSDSELIHKIFTEHSDIECAIHCAERTSVDTSVFNPYDYYISNVAEGIEFLKNLKDNDCERIVFSSSASIYEDVAGYMVTEESPINPRSPFAKSKYIMEMILQDFCKAYNMKCITLRTFNPIGADPALRSGLSEQNSSNIISKLINSSNNNIPFIINGLDWGTRDGSCIRDYVHIMDVANAHVKACEYLSSDYEISQGNWKNYLAINIGSGIGITVKEVVLAFENIIGDKIKIETGQRRPGDIAGSYASIVLAKKTMDWECKYSMEEAILDAVRWERSKKEKYLKEIRRN